MATGISSPLVLSGLYPSVDGGYVAANGKPFTSVSNAESALNGFPSKLSESCVGLTVLVKESGWTEAKEYWVQPKGTTPETYGLVEKGTTDYNDLDNKPTIGDGTNTALPIVGNVKVTASTASGETAGVTVTPGQNTGEIQMQFTLPKGDNGEDGADGQDGADGVPGHNPCLGRYNTLPAVADLPETPRVGDYIYVDDKTDPSNVVTTLYKYDETSQTGFDQGTLVDVNNMTFKDGKPVIDFGIDDEPTDESENLVKSGGVFKALEGNALVDKNLNFSSGASSSFFNITALTNKVYAYVKIDNISGTLRFKNSNYTDLAVYEFEDGVPFYCLIPANVSILWFSLNDALSSAVTAHIYITNNSVRERANDNTKRIDTCEGNILNLQNIQDKILTGKNISIVGDSISTYSGYSIEGHSYYPSGNVDSVEKTWWYKLILKTNGTLKENLSYAGAYVANVSGGVSLLTYIANAQATDIMFLAGGQNDSTVIYGGTMQIGTLDCTKEASELDDTKFADAYLHYVRLAMSKADNVVCIITNKLLTSVANVIYEIAKYYNLVCIDMRDKVMGFVHTSHPNAQGMQMMSECIYNAMIAPTDYNIINSLTEISKDLNKDNFEGFETIPLRNLVNGNITGSTWAVTNSVKHVTSTQLIKVDNGSVVKVALPSGMTCFHTEYLTNKSDASRRNYGYETEFITSGGYLALVFSKTDNSNIYISEVTGYTSFVNVYVKPLVDGKYYNNEAYNNFGNIDVDNIILQRGTITNTGIIANNGNRFVSEFIPVEPCSEIYASTPRAEGATENINALCYFYKINSDGSWTWLNQYDFNSSSYKYAFTGQVNKYFSTIVPPECNAVRFDFQVPSNTTLNRSDINSDTVVIKCHTRGGFKAISENEQFLTVEDVLKFEKGVEEWKQHVIDVSSPTDNCITCKPIKVIPGHRYYITHSNANKVYKFHIWEYDTLTRVGNYTPTAVKYTEHLNLYYTAPININYIRLVANKPTGASNFDENICYADDWHVIDVTPSKYQHTHRLWLWNRATSYAQSMAIQNGFVFQAFADGYIDIWNLETKSLVQSVFVPLPSDATVQALHCNNIVFGDKYDENDYFGVLWVNNESVGTKMVGIRIQVENDTFVFTKVYEVTPPVLDSLKYAADDQYIDFTNKMLVQCAYKLDNTVTDPSADGYTDVEIFVYTFSGNLQDGSFTLVHSFTHPIMWAVQGGRLIDNILYLVSGVSGTSLSNANLVNIFNVLDKKLISATDLKNASCKILNEEPQGIEFADGTYLSTTNGLYKLYQ